MVVKHVSFDTVITIVHLPSNYKESLDTKPSKYFIIQILPIFRRSCQSCFSLEKKRLPAL